MPTFAILAQVKLNIGTGQSSCRAWIVTDGEIYLMRHILVMPHLHGLTVDSVLETI